MVIEAFTVVVIGCDKRVPECRVINRGIGRRQSDWLLGVCDPFLNPFGLSGNLPAVIPNSTFPRPRAALIDASSVVESFRVKRPLSPREYHGSLVAQSRRPGRQHQGVRVGPKEAFPIRTMLYPWSEVGSTCLSQAKSIKARQLSIWLSSCHLKVISFRLATGPKV